MFHAPIFHHAHSFKAPPVTLAKWPFHVYEAPLTSTKHGCFHFSMQPEYEKYKNILTYPWESRFVLTFIFRFSEVPSGTSQLIPPVTNIDQSDPWLRPFCRWLPLKRCSAICLLKGISSLICARVLIGVSPTTTGVSPRNNVWYVDLLWFVPEHYASSFQ